ncbi:MAG TPA: hypothetical protein VFU43_08605 [Streptosporangiaceae bacterium]|nr:hypothetical protein [Streptosporangiaceae bacterium]
MVDTILGAIPALATEKETRTTVETNAPAAAARNLGDNSFHLWYAVSHLVNDPGVGARGDPPLGTAILSSVMGKLCDISASAG